MFYWCRLFSTTVTFVRLIVQTIIDCGPFMFMVAIITFAFGNYFFLLNQHSTNDNDVDGDFIPNYLGSGFDYVDTLISSYLIMLGEFNYGNYGNGKFKKYFVWGGFLLSTFLSCAVFMNMIIAIMGETFSNVMIGAE
jgi:hypothetical protein